MKKISNKNVQRRRAWH